MQRNVMILVLMAAAYAGGFGYGRWYGKDPATGRAAASPKILYYVDPMHPWYKSDRPGTAPDCGMKLTPVYAGQQPIAEAKPADLGPGAVAITPEKQQLIGVEYGTVEYRAAFDTIRASARVTLDETRIAKVQTKIEGWIDRVFVDFTGIEVRQGQPLLTIYSPEALATQQEYLLAAKAKETMAGNPLDELKTGSESLLAAARRRLELWDISAAQIEGIRQTGRPLKELTLYAPISGFVTERNAFPKQRITQDTMLYTVADLSTVWVVADVFEYETAKIRIGQPAALTLSYLPGRSFRGRVSYIQPQMDPTTRTMKVRLQFENPGYLLKPEMYGDVEFHTGGGQRLSVPQSAVLNGGLRQVVFVDRGSGYFEPRAVKTGEPIGERVEILSGLRAGERIVASGNFLIDSESQLKGALSDMAEKAHDQPHH